MRRWFALFLTLCAVMPPLAGPPAGAGPWVVRVPVTRESPVAEWAARLDLWELQRRKGYATLLVDEDGWRWLESTGAKPEVDLARTESLRNPVPAEANQLTGISGYPCYRTVEETFATMDSLVATYPTLASIVDIGNSWEKTQNAANGYDLRVLKLTNSAIAGPKPRLFIMTSVHARELTPAEISTRFAEDLLARYGVDADATWMLDHQEFHLLLQANPDGRKKAETALYWRKNTDNSYCANTNNRGADLNRNFSWQWGCCGGSSTSACSETYRGPSAASEPEVTAIQNYVRSIFADNRSTGVTDPAPADTPGIFMDIHSYSQVVLWPWGYTATVTGNGAALTTLGRKFGYLNGYTPEQAIDLYITDGTTDDFAYGDLGLAAYTIELGTAFFEDCTAFTSQVLPDNLPALWYAARVTRAPYQLPAGPDVLDLAFSANTGLAGEALALTARADDTRFNNSNGVEPVQNVAAAEVYIDTPPWSAGAVATALAAADGSFNASSEGLAGTVNTSGLSTGRHSVFVRARDTDNNWGPVSAAFFWVLPASAPVLNGQVREIHTLLPLAGTVTAGPYKAASSAGDGGYSLRVPAGTYGVTADAANHASGAAGPLTLADNSTASQDFTLWLKCNVFSDNVESGANGWTGGWARTTSTSVSPATSWTDSLVGNYSDNANNANLSKSIAAAGFVGMELRFQHRYDLETGWDFGHVEVSPDGSAWTELKSYTGYGQTTWNPVALDAPALDGAGAARVRFRLTTDTNTVGDGWYVDDVVLAGASLVCTDADGDNVANGTDCSPSNGSLWAAPSPALDLALAGAATTTLTWAAPASPGATGVQYDVLRAGTPSDFASATCLASNQGALQVQDSGAPAAGGVYFYLVRAENGCGSNLGTDSVGAPRSGRTCP